MGHRRTVEGISEKLRLLYFVHQNAGNAELNTRFGIYRRSIDHFPKHLPNIIQMDKILASLKRGLNKRSIQSELDA